jgi:hypothetical protein
VHKQNGIPHQLRIGLQEMVVVHRTVVSVTMHFTDEATSEPKKKRNPPTNDRNSRKVLL